MILKVGECFYTKPTSEWSDRNVAVVTRRLCTTDVGHVVLAYFPSLNLTFQIDWTTHTSYSPQICQSKTEGAVWLWCQTGMMCPAAEWENELISTDWKRQNYIPPYPPLLKPSSGRSMASDKPCLSCAWALWLLNRSTGRHHDQNVQSPNMVHNDNWSPLCSSFSFLL